MKALVFLKKLEGWAWTKLFAGPPIQGAGLGQTRSGPAQPSPSLSLSALTPWRPNLNRRSQNLWLGIEINHLMQLRDSENDIHEEHALHTRH